MANAKGAATTRISPQPSMLNTDSKPLVAALLVTYNRLDKLRKAMDLIRRQDVCAIVVVDNNSSDGTAEWLAGLSEPRLHCLSQTQNLGGAGGFSIGIQYVFDRVKSDWVLCFDDDAYPSPTIIQTFQKRYPNSDLAVVASAVYGTADDTVLEMNRPQRTVPATVLDLLRCIHHRDEYVVPDSAYRQKTAVDIQACSFVGMFLNTQKARKYLGPPQHDLFIYCDDLIYTSRAAGIGLRQRFDPELVFRHDCQNDSRHAYRDPWRIYYLARNYAILYRQLNPTHHIAPTLLRGVQIMARSRRSPNRLSSLKHLALGIYDGLRGDLRRSIRSPFTGT